MFQDFEKYDKTHGKYKYLSTDKKDYSTPGAFEAYQNMKKQYDSPEQRRQRFGDYLGQRRDLLDAMAQSALDSGDSQEALNEAVCKALDKVMKYYFK